MSLDDEIKHIENNLLDFLTTLRSNEKRAISNKIRETMSLFDEGSEIYQRGFALLERVLSTITHAPLIYPVSDVLETYHSSYYNEHIIGTISLNLSSMEKRVTDITTLCKLYVNPVCVNLFNELSEDWETFVNINGIIDSTFDENVLYGLSDMSFNIKTKSKLLKISRTLNLASRYDELKSEMYVMFDHLNNENNLNNLVPNLFCLFYRKVYEKPYLSSELNGSLTITEINKLMGSYEIVMNACKTWSVGYKNSAEKAFFTKLKDNVDTGINLTEKRKIVSEYSNNVVRLVQHNVKHLALTLPVNEQRSQHFSEVNAL